MPSLPSVTSCGLTSLARICKPVYDSSWKGRDASASNVCNILPWPTTHPFLRQQQPQNENNKLAITTCLFISSRTAMLRVRPLVLLGEYNKKKACATYFCSSVILFISGLLKKSSSLNSTKTQNTPPSSFALRQWASYVILRVVQDCLIENSIRHVQTIKLLKRCQTRQRRSSR